MTEKKLYMFLGVLVIFLGMFNLFAIGFFITRLQSEFKDFKVTIPPQKMKIRVPPQTIPFNISGEEIAATLKTALGEINIPLKIPSIQLNYKFPGLTTNVTTPELTFKLNLTTYIGFITYALLPFILMNICIVLLALLYLKLIR